MRYRGQEPSPECLLPQLDDIERRARAIASDLDDSAMAWTPPAGGWSIGQVFEHLVLGNVIYFPPMRALLARGRPAGARPWQPSFSGRLLIGSLISPRKLPAPARIRPGPKPRDHVVDAFVETIHETADLVRQSKGLDLRALRMTSPVSGFVRGLNFGDALIVIVVHAHRHLGQVERIRNTAGFPAP
jgi:DinB superfamily